MTGSQLTSSSLSSILTTSEGLSRTCEWLGLIGLYLYTFYFIQLPCELPRQGEQSRCEDLQGDQDAAHRAIGHQEEGEGVHGGDWKVPGCDEVG